MSQKKYKSEELPYITLLRQVPIKVVDWADKEFPTTYVIANCSNNKDTYDRSIEIKKKKDFFDALSENNLDPQANVQLRFQEAGADKVFPKLEATTQANVKFSGKSILSRGGIYDQIVKADEQFRYLHNCKSFLKLFKKLVEQNRVRIQQLLKEQKFHSPQEVFEELMKDDVLRTSFRSLVENEMKDESITNALNQLETSDGTSS